MQLRAIGGNRTLEIGAFGCVFDLKASEIEIKARQTASLQYRARLRYGGRSENRAGCHSRRRRRTNERLQSSDLENIAVLTVGQRVKRKLLGPPASFAFRCTMR